MGGDGRKSGFKAVMKKWCLAASIVLLTIASACGTVPDYSREGATEEDIEADLGRCETQARLLTNREEVITHDIRSARTDSLRPGAADFINEVQDLAPQRHYADIVDECMVRSGYDSNRLETRSLWQRIVGE